MKGDEVLIPIGVSNIYVSNELSRAVPVYYDLKEQLGNLILKL
jgi:prefoldin subunit 5